MGTSVSQPSPIGHDQGGPEWKDTKYHISHGVDSRVAITFIAKAYQSQFGSSFTDVIFDSGVQLVSRTLSQSIKEGLDSHEAFFIKCRKDLASAKVNSFFAELALCQATTALANSNPIQDFKVRFLTEVVHYIISRDLNEIIAEPGMPNHQSLERYISNVKAQFEKEIKADTDIKLYLSGKASK